MLHTPDDAKAAHPLSPECCSDLEVITAAIGDLNFHHVCPFMLDTGAAPSVLSFPHSPHSACFLILSPHPPLHPSLLSYLMTSLPSATIVTHLSGHVGVLRDLLEMCYLKIERVLYSDDAKRQHEEVGHVTNV